MNRLSIRLRVTLFYAAVMVLLLALMLAVIFVAGDHQLHGSAHTQLENAVKAAGNELEFENGYLEIDADIDLYPEGVTLVLYGPEGTPLLGAAPTKFPGSTPLVSDSFQRVEENDLTWEVYDLFVSYGEGGVWIRGIHLYSTERNILQSVFGISLVIFPLFVLLALIGGHLITRRAFHPVRRIIHTAEAIGSGNDLSQRIALPAGHQDEIYELGRTFDAMFDRLETSFNRERQFSSDVSHELRTPLSAILAQCDFALSGEASSADIQESLRSIHRQTRRMSTLISQLLELTRADQNRAMVNKETIDLLDIIEAALEQLEPEAEKRKIRLLKHLPTSAELVGDPALLLRVVINLVSNAIQYGHEGGYVRIALVSDGSVLTLVVEDDGIGISPEHLPHIFDRFYRIDPARATCEGNSGLGLSMVKWIVSAHEGTVSVDSLPQNGSTFTVRLPILSKEVS